MGKFATVWLSMRVARNRVPEEGVAHGSHHSPSATNNPRTSGGSAPAAWSRVKYGKQKLTASKGPSFTRDTDDRRRRVPGCGCAHLGPHKTGGVGPERGGRLPMGVRGGDGLQVLTGAGGLARSENCTF